MSAAAGSASESLARAARARLAAASELETLIGAFAVAYANYQKQTNALLALVPINDRAGLSIDQAISMQLSRAGLGPMLARNFAGTSPSLADVVERQHSKLGIRG